MKLIVLIPAYNEEKTIESIIKRIPKNICEKTEIVVINDGSEDDTENIAKSAGAVVISNPRNLGLAKTFSPFMELISFLTLDVFKFLLSDTISLLKIVIGNTDVVYKVWYEKIHKFAVINLIF